LTVAPEHFAEHLEVLRRHAVPLRLQQLSRALAKRTTLPGRAAVVTFDDGYADNLHNAKPLLERYDVPATVFLPSCFIGSENEFWWDELDRLLLHSGRLAKHLRLQINGKTHLLHRAADEERRKVLVELWKWAGVAEEGWASHPLLSLEQASAIANEDLIEIGAHTVNHPSLASLSLESQRNEIFKSKARLQNIAGCPVTSLAYSSGKRSDYSAETTALVLEAGFSCACSNFPGRVTRSTDAFQLPRLQVEDWEGEEIAQQLVGWFYD
jgi:peptidoglycan/xylan/chitin deacetylase (PgdA/CDA1 family)